ncbi:MAG TPA: ABC transporter substrate-binding protein [Gaiellaceae bacterium]|nr:ABC transporter substrate-binding protein [Gaiellaceae bacterium]
MSRHHALVTLAAASIVALGAFTGAFAGSSADPGITPTTILLGGTSPLTGPAAAYASVARGAKAYFDSVNASGGVAKRRIQYKFMDDAYNPAQTIQATRQLVEQDKVFAIFNSLGTEHNIAIREYLNQSKVPHLFVASGATTWGAGASRYPWTIGFQPSYQAEGWAYGQYVARTLKRARIAVLLQNDDYGKDLLVGLKRGLARSGSKVIAAQPYEVTASDVGSQMARLKASGANVLAIFATPRFAIQAYVYANRLAWRPLIINNAVSAASNIMLLASEGGRNPTVNGSITLNFLKDPTDPKWRNDPGMRRYRSIMSRYAKGVNVNDVYHVYGMTVAYETVSLFKRMGASPSRARLMAAARSISSASNPFLLPGIAVKTGRGDAFPVQQGQLQRWQKGRWVAFGPLWSSSRN